MSIFKISGIILKIVKQKESEFLLDVFLYDYGKIKLKAKISKTIKNLDIGYIINFEVNVKKENSISEIKNIKIKNEFSYLNKDYETIIKYLELIKIVNDKCPFSVPIFEIFNILNEVNISQNITDEKVIFAKLKLLNILGILKIENKNTKIQKILSFIEKENIKNILKLKGLTEEEKNKLNNLTLYY